jgi:hypothetical protein
MSPARARRPNLREEHQRRAAEEEVMHPMIIQAVATERAADMQAHAAAARRMREIRRSRPAAGARPGRRLGRLARIPAIPGIRAIPGVPRAAS